MNKILIASTNKDKIFIVSKILRSICDRTLQINCLRDIENFISSGEENGTIFERAKAKARECYEFLGWRNEYDFIIGIDDGIIIKDQIHENVKDYIKPIVFDNFLQEGEIVYIARAYHFIKNDGNEYSVLTKIPFKYKKPLNQIEINENSYPLSYVFCPINTNKSIKEFTSEENNEYYLKYSKEPISKVIH